MNSDSMHDERLGRRPIGLRRHRWLISMSRRIARWGFTPNQVSLASIGFSALGATCVVYSRWSTDRLAAVLLVGGCVAIALRGLCNLIDGLIAVEGGQATIAGPIYNDAPDRLSDLLFLVSTGYAIIGPTWIHTLGWAAGVVAVLTAYVRLLGGALGTRQFYDGPMGKPHRMGILAVALVACSIERAIHGTTISLTCGLVVIIAGGIVTLFRRLRLIVANLK